MRTIKKILTVILLMLGTNSIAQEPEKCGNDAYYNFDTETKILTIWGTGSTWSMCYEATCAPWVTFKDKIKKVKVEEGITHIGFFGLGSLPYAESISLPNSLERLAWGALAELWSIKTITIPENVLYVEEQALAANVSLEYLICEAENPPEAGNLINFDDEKEVVVLVVPDKAIEKYKAANEWKEFKSIMTLSYYLNEEYEMNVNANLKNLSMNLQLEPKFNKNILNYKTIMSSDTERLVITELEPEINKATSSMRHEQISEKESALYITVTAKDKVTTKTYCIDIWHTSNNNNLKSLESNIVFEPEFNKDVLDYYADTIATSKTKTITLKGIAEDDYASVSIPSTQLSNGNNRIPITVTSEEGTKKTYYMNVYGKSGEARLKSLQINQGSLEPAFSRNHKDYIWRVTNGGKYLITGVEPVDSNATVKEITKDHGVYVYEVTSEDKEYKEYYTIKMDVYNNNALLKSLKVKDFEFEEEFKPSVTNYYTWVPDDTKEVFIEAIAQDSNAIIIGQTGWQRVTGVENIYSIGITAEDFITKKSYFIHVRKEGLKTAIEQVEKSNREDMKIYSIDGRYLGITYRENKKLYIPNWLGHGVFIAKGSKHREKFTN